MLLLRVESASAEQRAALRLAVRDLNTALGYRVWALSPTGPHVVTFAADAFAHDPADTMGHCVQRAGGRWVVSIRPELSGAGRYATIVHELAHTIGIEHVRVGARGARSRGHVMSSHIATASARLTVRARARWSLQIAHEAAKTRLRDLR